MRYKLTRIKIRETTYFFSHGFVLISFISLLLQVLLGKSDVSGWGAFLKVIMFYISIHFFVLIFLFFSFFDSSLATLQNSVGKHEYLGEYTGELISHREADKRGKIYDRENSSFLFNLNDQA